MIREPPRRVDPNKDNTVIENDDDEQGKKDGCFKAVKNMLSVYCSSMKILLKNKNTSILFFASFFHFITTTTIGN